MSIKEAYKDLIDSRMEDLAHEIVQDNKYMELFNKTCDCFEIIKDKLTPEEKDVLVMYDETQAALHGRIEDVYYSAGLQDGIELVKMILLTQDKGKLAG